MTEICAAMGLTSLEAMPEIVAVNQRNYKAYRDGLAGLPGVALIEYDPKERSNYHYVVVEIDAKKAPLNRDKLLAILTKENVLARRYFWPGCHRIEPYRSLYPNAHFLLPQTEWLAAQIMTLPTGQSITSEIVRAICDITRTAFENAAKIRKILKQERPAVN